MGRVAVSAVIESLEDLYRVARGDLAADRVRRIEVADALVDTCATALALPRSLIARLGLLPLRTRRVVTSAGVRDVATFVAVRLTVEGQDLDDACPVLVGQVPLELMDAVVDPGRRALVGNPAHGGECLHELL